MGLGLEGQIGTRLGPVAPRAQALKIILAIASAIDQGDNMIDLPFIRWPYCTAATLTAAVSALKNMHSDASRYGGIVRAASPLFNAARQLGLPETKSPCRNRLPKSTGRNSSRGGGSCCPPDWRTGDAFDPLDDAVELGIEGIDRILQLRNVSFVPIRSANEQGKLRPINDKVDPLPLRDPKGALALSLVFRWKLTLQQTV
jgi:hypothetical protein